MKGRLVLEFTSTPLEPAKCCRIMWMVVKGGKIGNAIKELEYLDYTLDREIRYHARSIDISGNKNTPDTTPGFKCPDRSLTFPPLPPSSHLLKIHEELNPDERAEVAEAGADARAEAAILQGEELANQ